MSIHNKEEDFISEIAEIKAKLASPNITGAEQMALYALLAQKLRKRDENFSQNQRSDFQIAEEMQKQDDYQRSISRMISRATRHAHERFEDVLFSNDEKVKQEIDNIVARSKEDKREVLDKFEQGVEREMTNISDRILDARFLEEFQTIMKEQNPAVGGEKAQYIKQMFGEITPELREKWEKMSPEKQKELVELSLKMADHCIRDDIKNFEENLKNGYQYKDLKSVTEGIVKGMETNAVGTMMNVLRSDDPEKTLEYMQKDYEKREMDLLKRDGLKDIKSVENKVMDLLKTGDFTSAALELNKAAVAISKQDPLNIGMNQELLTMNDKKAKEKNEELGQTLPVKKGREDLA